jgi:hypothetical protein
MTKTTLGWSVFIAALGMMCGLLAVDISALSSWDLALKPVFVGTFLGHISVVIGAFVGGKLIPPSRDNDERTRVTDGPNK